MSKKIICGVEWETVTDGEYNEITATVNGQKLTVSSDRDGQEWDYRVGDDGELCSAGSDGTREDACREAIRDAKP